MSEIQVVRPKSLQKESRKERASNLELLRILAALFVIILHYNNTSLGKAFSYTESMPQHYQVLLILEILSICAVNIFVMISGYFLCTSTRAQVWKVIRLYIDVIFISVLRYCLYCVLGTESFTIASLFRRFIPLSWYTAVYCGLYLLHPYLNLMLKNRSRSQIRMMLLVFFFVCSLWPSGVEFASKALSFSPDSLSPISASGSGDGYTLMNFILMYFLGAYFRLYQYNSTPTKQICIGLIGYFACIMLNTVYANFFFGRATSYCNPLVIIQTVAIFIVFFNIKIQSKIVNALASCAFGVYLMHSFFLPWCQIEKYVTGSLWTIPIHAIICAVLIYAVCALIYGAYQKLFAPVFSWLQRILSFLNYEVK